MTLSRFEEAQRRKRAKPAPALTVVPTTTATGTNPAYVQAAYTAELEQLGRATEGSRNDALNRAAFNLGQFIPGGHLNRDEVANALLNTARTIGLPDGEAVATIASGMRSGAKDPRMVPEAGTLNDAVTSWLGKPSRTITPAPASSEVEAFWTARPELLTVQQMARARMTGPWAVLGCVLAHVITKVPPSVVLPPMVGGDGSLNLFIGLVGPSGSGKGAAEATARAAVNVGEYDSVPIGTGEGLVHAYVKNTKEGVEQIRTACLFAVAEIDTLTGISGRQGATILPILRSAWSGERLGFQNADVTRRLQVKAHEYRCTLVAGIQPARADALLGDSDGGTPQRFVWLPVTDPDAVIGAPEPQAFTWNMPIFKADMDGRTRLDIHPDIVDHVRAERLAAVQGQPEAITGHDTLARVKLAAALALFASRLTITLDDWALSGVIHQVSLSTRSGVQDALKHAIRDRNQRSGEAEAERALVVSDRLEEETHKRVSRWVRARLGRGPATVGDLKRAAASRDRSHVEAAIDRLVAAGQVARVTDSVGRETCHLEGE